MQPRPTQDLAQRDETIEQAGLGFADDAGALGTELDGVAFLAAGTGDQLNRIAALMGRADEAFAGNSRSVSLPKATAAEPPTPDGMGARPDGTVRRPDTATSSGHGTIDTGTGGCSGTAKIAVPFLRTVSLPSRRVGTVRSDFVLPLPRMMNPVVAPSVQWRIG